MGRGIMYMATTCPDALETFDANSFNSEDFASLASNFFENETDESANTQRIDSLISTLSEHGFHIVATDAFTAMMSSWPHFTPGEISEFCSCILFTGTEDECRRHKQSFFRAYLNDLKKAVEDISLDKFCEQSSVYDLTHLIDDDYSDVVYDEDMGFMTFMSFIRSLRPNTLYYFARQTVIMH